MRRIRTVSTQLTIKIQNLVADALHLAPQQVSPELAFGDLPQWDSMGHMEVMLLLEERYGVEINADTIAGLVSIPKIQAFIEENSHASAHH
jgi:acyl carrier protein